jgi:hypothetical protein
MTSSPAWATEIKSIPIKVTASELQNRDRFIRQPKRVASMIKLRAVVDQRFPVASSD